MRSDRILPRLIAVIVFAVACDGKDPVTPHNERPAPVLTAITPTHVAAGDPGVTLVVSGTGFVAQSEVRWNGAPRPTTFGSATQLTAQIPAADIMTAGTAGITVHTPAPGGGTSAAMTLQIQSLNPAPTVTSVSPALVAAGAASLTLTVTGTDFVEGAQVHWNGSARPTVVTPTEVTALIGAADLAAGSIVQISVVNPTPGGGSSPALPFQVVPTVLTVTSMDDVDDGTCIPEHCTLREAINLAHALPVAGRRIEIGTGAITLTAALPDITESLEIVGQGPTQVTIDANAGAGNERRIFTITGTASVEFSGMTLTGGYQTGGGAVAVRDGASLKLTNAVLTGNQAPDIGGGAVDVTSTGAVIVEDVTFSHNRVFGVSQPSGGGLAVRRVGAAGSYGAEMVVLRDVTFHDNEASALGGGFLIVGHPNGRVLHNVVVRDNRAGTSGGGASLLGPGTYDITSSTFDGNTASNNGGGIHAVGGGVVGDPVLRISNSTISNNASEAVLGFQGGGIFQINGGAGTGLFLTNSTLSGNRAPNSGALGVFTSAVLTNVTIIGNTASTDSGNGAGGIAALSGRVSVRNVLLAGNLAGGVPQNCWTAVADRFESHGGNLSDDASCAAYFTAESDLNSATAGVSPTLADNGGPTLTHALLAGSAAINTGNPASCPSVDQRGYSRQGTCDIGAFEFDGVAPAAGTGSASRRQK